MPFFEEDGDNHELYTYDFHPVVTMKESNFKKLLENSDNGVDTENWLMTYFIIKLCSVSVFLEIFL